MVGFSVEAGNKYFAAKDGILYTADMTKMVAYPGKRAEYNFRNSGNRKLCGKSDFSRQTD